MRYNAVLVWVRSHRNEVIQRPPRLLQGELPSVADSGGEQVGSFQHPALSHARVSIILARQECLGLLLVHIHSTSLGIMSWACGSLSPRERAGGEGL